MPVRSGFGNACGATDGSAVVSTRAPRNLMCKGEVFAQRKEGVFLRAELGCRPFAHSIFLRWPVIISYAIGKTGPNMCKC